MEDPPEKVLVRVYVDALNFYYRIAREYQFKWIDIKSLFLELIQGKITNAEIEKIYLFTSEVKWDEDARSRQHVYMNALRERYGDSLEVVEGRMKKVLKRGEPISKAIKMVVKDKRALVTILAREEKKTDVNLASQIVKDACFAAYKEDANKDFDIACLVSNDNDLEAPLKIRKDLMQRTLLISPLPLGRNSQQSVSELKEQVRKEDRIPSIPWNVLKKHRLPDKVGKWHCPELWKEEERKRAEAQARRP